uniref:EF-hand domain-containing protein n=1 Tax=Oryctolagus cuniculus TaxID=9986 RepID=A0A5F9CW51_RABIT
MTPTHSRAALCLPPRLTVPLGSSDAGCAWMATGARRRAPAGLHAAASACTWSAAPSVCSLLPRFWSASASGTALMPGPGAWLHAGKPEAALRSHPASLGRLVEKFSLDVSPEESRRLLAKYDLRNTGRFAYCAFLQSCVLLLQAKETSLLHRLKIQNAHKMEEAGAETASFYAALLRIQPKIVHCWRPMRRTFKTYDASGSGLLSVADFRKVSAAGPETTRTPSLHQPVLQTPVHITSRYSSGTS